MRFPTTAVALGALLATAEGCLTLKGVVSHSGLMMISLVDNGIDVCSFWGSLTGGQQWLTCKGGYASWVQLNAKGQVHDTQVGKGVCAYATGGGANNYRFAVNSQLVYANSGNPATDYAWNLSAREYC